MRETKTVYLTPLYIMYIWQVRFNILCFNVFLSRTTTSQVNPLIVKITKTRVIYRQNIYLYMNSIEYYMPLFYWDMNTFTYPICYK